MKCPTCPDTTLAMTERQGVEIDYCPQCRGVWLDRGELDKLISLGSAHEAAGTPATRAPTQQPAAQPYRRDFDDSDFGKRQGQYRRKSWLSDLFD